jgi:hypothetical protein
VLADEPFQLADQLSSGAGGEHRLVAQDHRLKSLLLQRAAPLRDAALGGDIAQRLTAEQLQGLPQQRRCLIGVVARLLDQRIEPPDVQLEAIGCQRVARAFQRQQPAEQDAQLGEVHVQRRDRTGRRPVAPQLVDEPVAGEGHAPRQQQQRQQRALASAGQRHAAALVLEHEWPQYPESPHIPGQATTSISRPCKPVNPGVLAVLW